VARIRGLSEKEGAADASATDAAGREGEPGE